METYPIIAIGEILVSRALLTERFSCELATCKGQCCVEGESGAPLEENEAEILRQEFPSFAPYMSERGLEVVQKEGFAVIDSDGDLTTPLVGGVECVYAKYEGTICRCAIEEAFFSQKSGFRKPISCLLYPIRIQPLSIGCALNYHQWHLCASARGRGPEVYRFLKEPIIAKFGAEFWDQLDAEARRTRYSMERANR